MIGKYLKMTQDYLLSGRDSKGKPRAEEPEILRGDPDLTQALIDQSPYKDKSTSFVFMEDKTWEEFGGFLAFDRFADFIEETLFPVFEKDEYSTLWIRHHREDGKTELNLLIPNTYLGTEKEKHIKTYWYRSDKRYLYDACALYSLENGLSYARDPDRARSGFLPKNYPELKRESANQIYKSIRSLVEKGQIRFRDDVIFHLKKLGYQVTRTENKASVSVKDKQGNRIRLRGWFFEKDFDALRPTEGEDTLPSGRFIEDYKIIEKRYNYAKERRKERTLKRFPREPYQTWKHEQSRPVREPSESSQQKVKHEPDPDPLLLKGIFEEIRAFTERTRQLTRRAISRIVRQPFKRRGRRRRLEAHPYHDFLRSIDFIPRPRDPVDREEPDIQRDSPEVETGGYPDR